MLSENSGWCGEVKEDDAEVTRVWGGEEVVVEFKEGYEQVQIGDGDEYGDEYF